MATTCKAWRHCIAAAHARPFGSFLCQTGSQGIIRADGSPKATRGDR